MPMLKAYGVDPQQFAQMYGSSELIRSSAVQRMIHDLAVHYAARQSASKRPPAPVPKVMRPGEAYDRPSGDSVAVAAAMRRFLDNPKDVRAAAAALTAKRRAAANTR